MKYYDYIVSLGHCCHVAMVLKDLKLQGESNVFDWSGGNLFEKCGIGGFEGKINLICNNFENFLNLEDFEEFQHAENKDRNVRNTRTGLQYLHDFPKSKSISDEFNDFSVKYNRRIDRLYKKLKDSESILFLFVTRTELIPLEIIKKAEYNINKLFDDKIDFLILQHQSSLKDEEYYKEKISNHTSIVYFNNSFYDDISLMNKKVYKKIINEMLLSQYKLNYLNKLKDQNEELLEILEVYKQKLNDSCLLETSKYFDEDWYRNNYSLDKNEDAACHYLKYGWQQGFNPSLMFDNNKYLLENPDVKKAGINPLVHYLRWGEREGRKTIKVNSDE